jgi:hypothetical protein
LTIAAIPPVRPRKNPVKVEMVDPEALEDDPGGSREFVYEETV